MSSPQIRVICLPRPFGSPHLRVPSSFPFPSKPCFSVTTSLPSYLTHMPSHTTMTLSPTSSTTSIFPACDNHTKSSDLTVVTTPRGNLLRPLRVQHEFPLLTTRPPPEPPPPIYGSMTAAKPSLLPLIRPPPKPPWSFHGLVSSVLSDLASEFSFFPSLCLCFLLFKAALLLFDKKPQKGYVFWNKVARVCWQSIVTKEAYEAGSHCNNFFTHPAAFKHPEKLDNFETNDSRIVRTQVKEIIRNWIGKKTVDSHSYIVRFRVYKRARRQKNALFGDNSEFGAAAPGQGAGEAKWALYHCNYCKKDITGVIRIKCAVCPDFDLCVECFSVGAELTPHKSNHDYRVMNKLSFPLISPDWSADEEMLILEGIEMYGLENWAEVAEHVGTKNKEACMEHYKKFYLNSPVFPLPDMSHAVGRSREELLATAKGKGDDKKGSDSGPSVNTHVAAGANKKASNKGRGKPRLLKDSPKDGDFGGNKSNSSRNEGRTLVEASGYNPKRQEFDPEYDDDAEKLLADMEFNDNDTEEEIELKLRIIRIYNKRLDERERRKKFILERNLLYENPFEKDLTPEEKAICRKYDVFMRFHTKENHDELLRTVISEHRYLKKILETKEAIAAGCHTSAEADIYLANKRRNEAEGSARGARESTHVVPNNHEVPNALMSPDSTGTRPARPATSSADNATKHSAADLLSEVEKRFCCELRLSPTVYLKMQEDLSVQMIAGRVSSKSDAHQMFKNMDPMKIDRVYDMLIKKGVGSP